MDGMFLWRPIKQSIQRDKPNFFVRRVSDYGLQRLVVSKHLTFLLGEHVTDRMPRSIAENHERFVEIWVDKGAFCSNNCFNFSRAWSCSEFLIKGWSLRKSCLIGSIILAKPGTCFPVVNQETDQLTCFFQVSWWF
jgi:hypothetical protein